MCVCVRVRLCVCVNSIVTLVESQAGWSDQIQIIEAWGITAKVYPQELPTLVQPLFRERPVYYGQSGPQRAGGVTKE